MGRICSTCGLSGKLKQTGWKAEGTRSFGGDKSYMEYLIELVKPTHLLHRQPARQTFCLNVIFG
jgi:hypothetical protein